MRYAIALMLLMFTPGCVITGAAVVSHSVYSPDGVSTASAGVNFSR